MAKNDLRAILELQIFIYVNLQNKKLATPLQNPRYAF